MKVIVWILSLLATLGCKKQPNPIVHDEQVMAETDEYACEQEMYRLISCKYPTYAEWKIEYMDHIFGCVEDSAKIILLAQMDANHKDYTFFVFGLMDDTEPYETIYNKYPISFHCPGCESSPMGELYNLEMKKHLKKNEGIDYDSVFSAEQISLYDPLEE